MIEETPKKMCHPLHQLITEEGGVRRSGRSPDRRLRGIH